MVCAIRIAIAAAASAGGLAAMSADAGAVAIDVVGDRIEVSGGPSLDAIGLDWDPGFVPPRVYFEDFAHTQALQVGIGCQPGQPGSYTVICDPTGVTRISFDMGDGEDDVLIRQGIPAAPVLPWAISFNMGGGADNVTGQTAGPLDLDMGPGLDEVDVGSTVGPVRALGGDGDDSLDSTGPAGATLDGGKGRDFIYSGPGIDTLIGGPGADSFSWGQARQLKGDSISCGPGRDTVATLMSGLPEDCPINVHIPKTGKLRRRTIEFRLRVTEPVSGRIWLNRTDLGVTPKRRRTATPENGTIRMPLTKLAQKILRIRAEVTARLHGQLIDLSGDGIILHGAIRFTR